MSKRQGPERKEARVLKAIVVAKRGYRCEWEEEEGCGATDNIQLHHKDCNRFNNTEENAQLLCDKHHKMKHGVQSKPYHKRKNKEVVIVNKEELVKKLTELIMADKMNQNDLMYLQLLCDVRAADRKDVKVKQY